MQESNIDNDNNLQDIYAKIEPGFLSESNSTPEYLEQEENYQRIVSPVDSERFYVTPTTQPVPEKLSNPNKKVSQDIANVTKSVYAFRQYELRRVAL